MNNAVRDTTIIIQSYEEIRYLLELLKKIDNGQAIRIAIYGNHDLFKHSVKLFQNKNEMG